METLSQLWSSVMHWAPVLLRILLILFIGLLFNRLLRSSIRRIGKRAQERTDLHGGKRIQTLSTVLASVSGAAIFAVVITLILGEFGVNIGPILAAAGVLGVAIGFGSQSLVRDFLNGFFFLFEGQVRVGDFVEAGGKSGMVEAISIRTLTLRDFAGAVHVIPHGEITTVTNMTKDFSRAVVQIGVAYREDPEHVLAVLRDEAEKLCKDETLSEQITGEPEVFGIDAFNNSDLGFRVRFTTTPGNQWAVARAYRMKIKTRFDREGIEIPFPHQTLYWGEGKDHKAPPLHVQMQSVQGKN